MIDERFFSRSALKTIGDVIKIPSIAALITDTSALHLDAEIQHINVLKYAQSGDLCFFDNIKYKQDFINCQGSFCVAHPKYREIAPATMMLIPSEQPYLLYAHIAQALYHDKTIIGYDFSDYTQDKYGAYIHKYAQLEDNIITAPNVIIQAHAEIGANTIIQAGTTIGTGVAIGRQCIIGTGVHISHSLVGDNVHLAAGAVIGQAGFGYAMGRTHETVPQLGRVIIQDNVHIGAGTTIDRGAILDTMIGEGSKLDNLIQVGHNVIIGRHCVFAGQCAIAGSTTFGDYVVSGGQTAYAGHLQIGAMARIAGGSGVATDIPAGQTWSGNFAKPKIQHFREVKTLEKLSKKS